MERCVYTVALTLGFYLLQTKEITNKQSLLRLVRTFFKRIRDKGHFLARFIVLGPQYCNSVLRTQCVLTL